MSTSPNADSERVICAACQRHIDWWGEEPTGDCGEPSCRFYADTPPRIASLETP